MALISVNNVSIQFGGPLLLDCAELHIEEGERLCLIGRNGAGKSTLLKLIDGAYEPDSGTVTRIGGCRTALLQQEVPAGISESIYDVVAGGKPEHAGLLIRYHELTANLDESRLDELHRLQEQLDAKGAWQLHTEIMSLLTRMQLDENAIFATLSAGYKRRVILARALISDPDVILLDEPTNHLDIDSIVWLEEFLLGLRKTLVFVTHDREFMKKIASRIVEIDRGRILSFECGYEEYLSRKEAWLESEEKTNREFDKKLAQEEVWVRQGIKARRTRNEGRVRALVDMRNQRNLRREKFGSVDLQIQEAARTGKLVIEGKNLSFAYGDKRIVNDFSTSIMRGDRIGIIGPNGSGKSTLIKLLLGQLQPESGSLRQGTNLEVAYFDQLRDTLDDSQTMLDNIGDGNDMIFIDGQPRHVISYLKDFLFTPEQVRAPIAKLSGGERNRLLLARLFAKPSNVLVLDEPTNDLDAETLDLLEEKLFGYGGTLLMVSHDRAFLNNVVTSIMAYEEDGLIHEYVGGYDDWLRQRSKPATAPETAVRKERVKNQPKKRKLSNREREEFKNLPGLIEALDREKEDIMATMSDPDFYKIAGEQAVKLQDRLDEIELEVLAAYERWEELEELS